MKITLDIPDGIIAGFFNGVEVTAHGMQLVSLLRRTGRRSVETSWQGRRVRGNRVHGGKR